MDYVSLHNHTVYSILDALSTPKELFNKAKDLNQKAIAVTDHGTAAGVWDAYKASKETGVKLIQGVEFYFTNDADNREKEKSRHLILLAKNQNGYKNLLTLNRKGFDKPLVFGGKVMSIIDWKLLEQYSSDLICLTACSKGIVGQLINNKKWDDAESTIKHLKDIFGYNFALEVQPHALIRANNNYHDAFEQSFTNFHINRLAKKFDVKVVATTNSHYISKEDSNVHDTFLAIGARQPVYSNNRIRYDLPEFYVKTGEEVYNFFKRNFPNDAAKFVENSLFFADMCEDPKFVDPKSTNPSGKELPSFPIEDEKDYQEFINWLEKQNDKIKNQDKDSAFLRFRCEKALEKKTPKGKEKEFHERLEEELDVLDYQKFSSYMLIVADFLDWAKNNAISIGFGRGSVGGSIIAYLLDIHKADPVKYNLIFARFQNRQRTEAPDIDVDISKYKRDRVIQYLRNKYGDEYVAAVSNFNEITPKVYARDLSRSCMLGESRENAVKIGNAVADIIPNDIKSANQLKRNALFVEWSKKYPKFTENLALVEKIRNMSQHAAGFVVGKRPLVGLVPLRRDKDEYSILEFEKENTADSGLIKIDLLGLSTLDIIENTLKLIEESGQPLPTDHINFDLYDKPTYDLITSGNTYGVFQFGTSAGTIDLCKKIKPKNIEDLAIITTLARPAARDIRKAFIETREGKRKFSILHPSLKSAFEKTFGFGLFDESILSLAQSVAGWSMHSADRVRKMIKDKGKNPEKDAKLRKEFIEDSVKNGIEQDMAVRIWDEEVQKFAGYTFNKSHAVMYSFISYTTAYLKAHYPLEFLLANLIFEVNSTNAKAAKPNIDKIKQELRNNKVNIIPPDINKSDLSYKVIGNNQLLTGLDALKYVSDDAIKDILTKRPFNNFLDFMVKVDSRKVRSNAIQALACSGALDSFGLSRKQIFLYCSDFRKKLQVWLKKHDPTKEIFEYPWPKDKEWSLPELFALERYYLGEAVICGKKDAYGRFFKEGKYALVSQIKNLPDKTQIPSIKGEIKDIFEFKVKKEGSKFFGHAMAKILIEDENNDQVTVTVFPDRYEAVLKRIKQLGKNIKLEEGVAINFAGTINMYQDEFSLILDNFYAIYPTPQMPIDRVARKVSLKKAKSEPKNDNVDDLFSDIEDELYDEGLIEFNDEID